MNILDRLNIGFRSEAYLYETSLGEKQGFENDTEDYWPWKNLTLFLYYLQFSENSFLIKLGKMWRRLYLKKIKYIEKLQLYS